MTVAAHKIGGPVASGALYLKNRTPLRPRIFGGGQEAGRRAGTQDLRTQLAFAAAARTLTLHVAEEREKLQALSDKLYATLTAHPRIHATMGDYAQAARVWGRGLRNRTEYAALQWACEPASPLGAAEEIWPAWGEAPTTVREWRVLDCAYRPLWLESTAPERALDQVWQLWTPNKALGMTGVRAAYAIAPVYAEADEVLALQALAPSWVVGAHGVAMLQAWVEDETQQWLAQSLTTLTRWKAQQLALCAKLGWQVVPGHQANYFVARLPVGDISEPLAAMRAQGVKLRDCASFGLPGHVRLGVLPPVSQAALARAWADVQ